MGKEKMYYEQLGYDFDPPFYREEDKPVVTNAGRIRSMSIKVDEQDFGTVCVCALRYAMGRETYMPSLVRDFVRPLLTRLPDKTLAVMIMDCEEQERMNLWGSATIDKPGWVKWKQELLAEKERRSRD